MAKILVLVCLVLVAMDVLAGILGIKAEFAKNKVTRMRLRTIVCKESNRDAFKLGLAAAVLLALAHVTSNMLSGCICTSFMEELERSSSTKRKIWFACHIFSWIIVAIGLPALIMGIVEDSTLRGSCQLLHHHFGFIGGISCFLHGLLSVLCIASYLSATLNFGINESSTGHAVDP
ncbi:protein VASCULATURE COMPLEXITY AND CONNECTIVITY-like [Fagus crenata]